MSELHPSNASLAMLVTDEGIVMLERFVQFANASSAIVAVPLGMETLLRLEQL